MTLRSSAKYVAARMISYGIERAPIVQEGQVLGVVSLFEFLAYLALEGKGTAGAEADH